MMTENEAEVQEDTEERDEKEDVAIAEDVVEIQTGEKTQTPQSKKSSSHSLKETLKQVETFGQALGEALQGRGNVVMVRVNDEALDHLDMLVEAEITKSRSESAAFLINEGITTNSQLFEKISSITEKISALREQLRKEVKLNTQEEETS
jgi:hypothetical protein